MKYYLVDVFSDKPLGGNGLAVVFPEKELEDSILLKIAQEFKQFETIFVYPEIDNVFPVRIFTVDEELDFAGHPVLGCAAVIFSKRNKAEQTEIRLKLKNRIIITQVEKSRACFNVSMNQGRAEFISSHSIADIKDIIAGLNLSEEDISAQYPVEIVSTGLSYLYLPLNGIPALKKTRIIIPDMENLLSRIGAKFVYIFEPESLDCRNWDNLGLVEDTATGSAAGPLAAYLVKNNFKAKGENIIIKQGSYTSRPSSINAKIDAETDEVMINGAVSFFAEGNILI